MAEVVQLIAGRIWHTPRDPWALKCPEDALECYETGALAVDADGVVAELGAREDLRQKYPQAAYLDYGDRLILPGFIDTHLHYPQLDIIGCYGEQLLGWLQKYTFPTETNFADEAHAKRVAERLVTELFAHGTTMGVVFSSSHRGATETLFEDALGRGLRAVIGKVGMDRNAPEGILCDPETDAADQAELIERWHGREGRLHYAVTNRFAPVCSEPMMRLHGELYRSRDDLYLQTHYAENQAELAWVAELFPKDRDYLAVYERFGMVGPRTILAHGIHVEEARMRDLAAAGAIIAHCPTSNFFLGSGLFAWDRMHEHGVKISLATDIGGGTSLSLWQTMNEAYKMQQLRGVSLHPVKLFHSATAGNAAALGMEGKLGDLKPGKAADLQVLNPGRQRLLRERFEPAHGLSPSELLFALTMLADDRLVERVFVQGREVYRQD